MLAVSRGNADRKLKMFFPPKQNNNNKRSYVFSSECDEGLSVLMDLTYRGLTLDFQEPPELGGDDDDEMRTQI